MVGDEFKETPTQGDLNIVSGGYPLTEAQMEICLSSQLDDEESCAFNQGLTLTLTGPLNENALRVSIAAVVERHEVLRAALNASGDRLLIRHSKLPLPIVDVTAFRRSEQDRQIADLQECEAWKAFDLMTGPLIRMQLVRRGLESHVLLITAHEIICDQRSLTIIATEISEFYTALCSDQEMTLPEPAAISGYTRLPEAPSSARIEAYWDLQFSEPAPPLNLPLDYTRPATHSHRGATYVTDFSSAARAQAQQVGENQGYTMSETLLAGFNLLLTRLTGQSDIVVGVPSTNAGDAPPVGQSTNLLPVRLRPSTSASFASVLKETQQQLSGANKNSSYPYRTLVRKLASPRNANRLPLIEVLFHLEQPNSPLHFHNLTARLDRNPKRFVNFDLSLHLVESAGKIRVYCDYNADLFTESSVARWMREYEDLFLAACEEMNRPVAQLAASGRAPAAASPLDGARIFRHRINLGELFK